MKPYYEDEAVTLYHGDCLEVTAWLDADVLVTDPPYGLNDVGGLRDQIDPTRAFGIAGDATTEARDRVVELWGDKPAALFGSPKIAPPQGTRQVLAWVKAGGAGIFGTVAGFRRDWEAIFLCGNLPKRSGAESSVIRQRSPHETNGHRHAKPVGLMEKLVALAPGVVADPFAGSGTTLIAARNLGRKAIGVEIEERYCEIIAKRLAQAVLL